MNLLEKMQENKYVNVKPVDGEDNLYACNFTRDAFKHGIWNQYTTTARGLFLSSDDTVCVRGFNKFFNIGENKETSLEAIFRKVEYPIFCAVKENGFLGLIGPREEKGKFYFFTKAGNTIYSVLIEKVFLEKTNSSDRDYIWNYLHNSNATMAVEVICPEYDKHIIPYQKNEMFILAFIKNQKTFEIINEPFINTCGNGYGQLHFARNIYTIWDEEELEKVISIGENSRILEGFVFRDSNNYMFKLKSNLYKKTKAMRPAMNSILSGKKKLEDFKNKPYYDTLEKIYLTFGIPTWYNNMTKRVEADMTAVHDILKNSI